MSVRIINADVMAGLAMLDDESVHCCVTSPPYWGLRDYGTATWEGGSSICDHVASELRTGLGLEALGAKYRGGGKKAARADKIQFRDECGKCGAVRVDRQIGLEATPELFVAKVVEVFREVRRVLRKDGTLWVNLGDSYSHGGCGSRDDERWPKQSRNDHRVTHGKAKTGLKPKDLVGIPWMVAFALRSDGWWLRQEIIWHKPNPMPESIGDRCTKAHEHLFLLSKAQQYHFDAESIKEPVSGTANPRRGYKMPDGWDTGPGGHGSFHRKGREKGRPAGVTPKSAPSGSGVKANESYHAAICDLVESRNKRSVWTISTQAYSQAHFATFPEALPETCIKAGCPAGGTVLDPFGGAGTTGLVADKLGRNAVLIELNPEYAAMAEARIKGSCPMFAEVTL